MMAQEAGSMVEGVADVYTADPNAPVVTAGGLLVAFNTSPSDIWAKNSKDDCLPLENIYIDIALLDPSGVL
jgi:hypothetical protein